MTANNENTVPSSGDEPDDDIPDMSTPYWQERFAKAKRGRPPMLPAERRVRMNLMIEPDLARELDRLGNKSAFVNEAIRKALAGA